jgi:methylated-DNA-[protein]-cysteine S-methyltransferase
MKAFRDRVYALARQVPAGKVVTYGQLAVAAGSPGAARAVGMCMKTNPFAPAVPCHRVVAADGRLTGFSVDGGIAKKKQMLVDEGVTFINDKVDMKRCLFREL